MTEPKLSDKERGATLSSVMTTQNELLKLAERGPWGNIPHLDEAAKSLRRKVQRAVKRGTGCRLTPIEVYALDFMEGDGHWWNAARANQSSTQSEDGE